jgi:hypothetical protein
MSETLKPCPFCGHAAVMPRPHNTRAFVECTGKFAFEDGPDCGARTGYYSTEAGAIAAWNRRVQPDALRLAEEALFDMREGWRYIRDHHGDLYGVGWDRAQEKADEAIDAIRAAQEKP